MESSGQYVNKESADELISHECQGLEPVGEGSWVSEMAVVGEEAQITGVMRPGKCFEKQAPEQSRQHPYRQEETGLAGNPVQAIGRETATGHNAVHMRMMGHGRSPGM